MWSAKRSHHQVALDSATLLLHVLIDLDVFAASPLDQLQFIFKAEHHLRMRGCFAQLTYSVGAFSLALSGFFYDCFLRLL